MAGSFHGILLSVAHGRSIQGKPLPQHLHFGGCGNSRHHNRVPSDQQAGTENSTDYVFPFEQG